MKYWSHPNYLLKDHILDVTKQIRLLTKSKDINYSLLNTNKEEIQDILTFMALTHDVGKYSDYFQYYIHNENDSNWILSSDEIFKFKKNKRLKNHSFISAIVLLTILQEWFKKDSKDKEPIIFNAVTAVMWHHSDMKDISYWRNYEPENVNELKEILSTINFNEYNELINKYFPDFNLINLEELVNRNLEKFKNEFKEISLMDFFNQNSTYNIFEQLRNIEKPGNNQTFLFLMMFSFLIYSDKYSAIFKQQNDNDTSFNYPDLVDKYKEYKNFKTDSVLNKEREEVYHKVANEVNNIQNEKLFNLTMNTGYGKTLTSFNFALKLKNKLLYETGIDYKVIYAMPFTSIIEQNFEVIKEIMNLGLNNQPIDSCEVGSNYLLKHHYLAKTEYIKEEDTLDLDKSKFLIETWDSKVIFTTFVQLFEVFFTNQNKRLTKFPNLINSIIVIDEIQALTEELYIGFQLLFEKISQIFNIYIIYTSATQPYFTSNTFSLLKDYKDYYKSERTQMILSNEIVQSKYLTNSKLEKEEGLAFIDSIIDKEKNKNILVILNTKQSAYDVYKHLKDNYNEKDIILLSNSLIGKHKQEKIKYVNDNMVNKNIILVSTQLIEAGVDLDFDVAIRDFAPLPNLLQSAGRVNRNFKKDNFYGKFYIMNWDNSCLKIYGKEQGSELLEYTFTTIKKLNTNSILEPEYLRLNDFYYQLMKEHYTTKTGLDLLSKLENMEYKDMKLKLIQDNLDNVTLFINFDEHSNLLWDKYLKINEDYLNKIDRKKMFLEMKSDFLNYTLKIPAYKYKEIMLPYKNQKDMDKDSSQPFIIIESEYCSEYGNNLYTKEYGINLSDNNSQDNIFL